MSTLVEFESALTARGLELIPHYHCGPVRPGDPYQLWTVPDNGKVVAALVQYPRGHVVCFVGVVEPDKPSPQRSCKSVGELPATLAGFMGDNAAA